MATKVALASNPLALNDAVMISNMQMRVIKIVAGNLVRLTLTAKSKVVVC
jgi:hypothetical protein